MQKFVAAALLALAAGCHTSSPLSRLAPPLTPEAEALAGRRAAVVLEDRFGGTVADTAAIARMEQISLRLAADNEAIGTDWHFHLLATDEINAFSLPGGLIYITRGLYARLNQDDQLLAAVIAHEMAHVVRKDSLRPACSSTEVALCRETAADAAGVRYLIAAGYPSDCLIDLLFLIEDVQSPGWARARIDAIKHQIQSPSDNTRLLVSR